MNTTAIRRPRYVPVLKVKEGEKSALEMLDRVTAAEIWPLFEIVEMKGEHPDLAKHLRSAFKGLPDALRATPVYFLDTHEIAPAGPDGAREAFFAATSLGRPFIPVTGISRKADIDEAIKAIRDHGIAIRLTRSEFERDDVPRRLLGFLQHHNIRPSNVHLIVDVGAVNDVLPEGVQAMIQQFLPMVPHILEWWTLTVVACAFPQSMSVAARKSQKLVERADWKGWLNACYAKREQLARLPIYGDGGIQHPSGVEGFEAGKMSVSATIRYALADAWLLVKGESTDVTPYADQVPELARTLVANSGYFAGPKHCHGCGAIARAARGSAQGHKRALDWRRVGTAHHITTTVQQLRSLLHEP